MARNTVTDVGIAGIIRDIKPQLLPPSVWSDGRNVRFKKTKVYGMGGVEAVLGSTVTNLLNVGLISSAVTKYTIYTTGGKVFSYDGVSTFDITRAVGGDYSEDGDNLFDINVSNGIGLLNNGIDLPQQWDPSVGSNLLTALANWDTNWTAQKIVPFKALLVALNMTESASPLPHKMRWSHPAEPGAVPSTWDETDATKEAGEFSFPDTDKGELVNGRQMGETLYVYKEGSIWAVTYVGGNAILAARRLTEDIGISVPRSLVNLPFTKSGRRFQFFAGDENFFMNDGVTVTPVFEEIFRDEILTLRDATNYKSRSFSVVNYAENELWYCIPESGADYATLAICINYANNTYTLRELSGAANIVAGIGVDAVGAAALSDLPFSDDTFFSDDTGFFNQEVVPGRSVVIEASPSNEQLYYLDTGSLDYDGGAYPRYVRRQSIPTIKNDSRNPDATIVDYSKRQSVSSIVPKLYGGSARVKVGIQERENTPVSWVVDEVINTGVYRHDLSQPVSGRFISFEFSNVGSADFEIGGFDYEIDVLGEF